MINEPDRCRYVLSLPPAFHSVTAGGHQRATSEAGENGARRLQPGPQSGGQHQGRVWPVYW